jgi:hypothetical protein
MVMSFRGRSSRSRSLGWSCAVRRSGTWSAAREVPGSSARICAYAIAIAPGIDAGVLLELVYVGSPSVFHTRLTDDAAWTRSTSAAIPGASDWGAVHLAASR